MRANCEVIRDEEGNVVIPADAVKFLDIARRMKLTLVVASKVFAPMCITPDHILDGIPELTTIPKRGAGIFFHMKSANPLNWYVDAKCVDLMMYRWHFMNPCAKANILKIDKKVRETVRREDLREILRPQLGHLIDIEGTLGTMKKFASAEGYLRYSIRINDVKRLSGEFLTAHLHTQVDVDTYGSCMAWGMGTKVKVLGRVMEYQDTLTGDTKYTIEKVRLERM